MAETPFNEQLDKLEEVEIKKGRVVRGPVIAVLEDSVIVNLGYKYDGLVPISEFSNKVPEIGEEIPVIVKKIDDKAGVVLLSFKSAERREALQKVSEAKEKGLPVKGVVIRKIKGGYLVDLGFRFLKGVLLEELSGASLDGPVKTGSEVEAYVDAIDVKRRRVILDRERFLKERKEKGVVEFLQNLKVGEKLKGKVKNITDFGVFVNIGPVDVLIRKRELSWRRFEKPEEVVKVGDEVEFVLTHVDIENKKLQGSVKQATKTRWHMLAEKVKAGDIFEGKVKKKTSAGIYVWLMPGLDGLLPKEEFSKYIRDVSLLAEGDPIRVRVKSVNLQARMIILTHPTR